MPDKVLFSSKNTDWETPDALFDLLNREFEFTLDVCANKDNAKLTNYLDETQDALKFQWFGTCWMNPPYSREVGKWMRYAMQQVMNGSCEVVCLVPARTDTQWWWDTARWGEVRFLKGRLKFVGAESSAPFPSAVVIFRRYMRRDNGTVIWWDRNANGDIVL